MNDSWPAALAACAALAVADVCNRRVVGWLPDDPPRPGRKQHRRPIPLAGVALAPVLVPWAWAEGESAVAVATAIAAVVGFLDDRGKERGRDLDWRWKALGLGLAAAVVAASSIDPFSHPGAVSVLAALGFVLINATNFLDNTDGVSAALSAASLLALAGGTGPFAAAGFAAIGFLPWNWPRPRLFLGDAGAYQLGVLVAAAVSREVVDTPHALCAVAVQLTDFVQVVTARLVLGVPPWVGDRRHLSHILQNLGMPRAAVAPALAAAVVLVWWVA